MKKIILFLVLTIFFSFLIFGIKSYFFEGFEKEKIEYIEEKYISPIGMKKNEKKQILKEKFEKNLNSASKISFIYFPKEFLDKTKNYKEIFLKFLKVKIMNEKIDRITVQMYERENDVRGKMKNRSIKFFGVLNMKENEFLSVGIHEFGHFLDLYFLKKKVLKDLSEYFYEISWKETKVLKPGQEQKDFVSGYSMTNKYEDFAESFVYYVLHNGDFLKKSEKSFILKQKYNFFDKYLFRNKKFIKTDFSNGNKIKDYYRDITKIDYNLQNFLQYLEKSI